MVELSGCSLAGSEGPQRARRSSPNQRSDEGLSVGLVRRLRVLALAALLLFLVGCGSAQGPGGGGGGPKRFEGAVSQSCAQVTGMRALYWDFMLGAMRTDYPETYRLLPYVGSPFTHQAQPLYSFMFPPGWSAFALTDPSLQLMGANVVRADGQAVWRRLNLTASGNIGAELVIGNELDQMTTNLGLSGQFQVLCALPVQVEPGTGSEASAVLVDADGFTAMIQTQVYRSAVPGTSVVFIQMAVAPQAQFDEAAYNVFFPLSGQMLPGGGSGEPECNDGVDNDGDGKIDYPDDPGCSSPEDDSEAG